METGNLALEADLGIPPNKKMVLLSPTSLIIEHCNLRKNSMFFHELQEKTYLSINTLSPSHHEINIFPDP